MAKKRTIVLSVVLGFLAMLIYLCIFTYCRISIPVFKLKKQAERYQQYKRNFSLVPWYMKLEQVRELKAMKNDIHTESAMNLGVPGLIDVDDVDHAVKEKKLIFLPETRYWRIKELKDSLQYVTPDTLKLLYMIGKKFQENLEKNNLPPYRFTISSVLRTAKAQEILARKNRNATRNISSHQFGTSVDILFTEFEYTAGDAITFNFLTHYSDRPVFKKKEFDELGSIYSSCLKTVLGSTLLELQREGKCYVIYEFRQPVFHVTLASKF